MRCGHQNVFNLDSPNLSNATRVPRITLGPQQLGQGRAAFIPGQAEALTQQLGSLPALRVLLGQSRQIGGIGGLSLRRAEAPWRFQVFAVPAWCDMGMQLPALLLCSS